MILPLTPSSPLPHHYYLILSSVIYLVSVLSNPSLGAANKSALVATVMAWTIPKEYGFLCPIILMVATLYPYIGSVIISRLASATINLFSAMSILLLILSPSFFLLTYPYLPPTLNGPLPFFGYAL
ncbi:MAG: hypothetical protein QXM93_02695 [Candidatus Methanomethyliaceae archaeon]